MGQAGESSVGRFCMGGASCCPVIPSLPCTWQQHPSASLGGCGIDKIGQGGRLFCHIHQCCSSQPPALLMPRVDPDAVLSSRCKLVLRNN